MLSALLAGKATRQGKGSQCGNGMPNISNGKAADLNVGVDGVGINDRPAGCSIRIHGRHGHEAVDEGPCICFFKEHTDG